MSKRPSNVQTPQAVPDGTFARIYFDNGAQVLTDLVAQRAHDAWQAGVTRYTDDQVHSFRPLRLMEEKAVVELEREKHYWFDQHRTAEGHRIAMVRRMDMLEAVLAKHGLLDEAGIRDDYVGVLARHIRYEADSNTLSVVRREIASLIFELGGVTSVNPELEEPLQGIKSALVKALEKLLDVTDCKTMSLDTALAKAAERIALMDVAQ
jgi:hypothetical protein